MRPYSRYMAPAPWLSRFQTPGVAVGYLSFWMAPKARTSRVKSIAVAVGPGCSPSWMTSNAREPGGAPGV